MQHVRMSRRGFLASGSAVAAAYAVAAAAGRSGMVVHAADAEFRLTTFKADVTPPLGTPIYSSYKPLAVVEYPLMAKGVVLESGGQRYVLCAVDYCELRNSTYALFRQTVAEAAGTDVSRVAMHTVHQHTAEIADGNGFALLETVKNPPPHPSPSVFAEAAVRLGEAVKASMGNFQPVDRIGLGQAKVEQVASNRRVPMPPDNKIAFRGSSCKDPALTGMPEGLVDPFLKTITFSQGEKPLARLHFYAVHPQSFYGDPRASYDFPGIARERLETQENVFQVYFTGCAGDIAAGKYNDASPEARAGLAERLFAGMEASVAATEYAPIEPVQWRVTPVTFAPREDAGFAEADCSALMADEKAGSVPRADAAWRLAWRQRANQPFELSAMRIGKACMLNLPGEAVIAYQFFAQEARPDLFMAVAAYADSATGYICLESMFPEGSYEPSASTTSPQSEGVLKAGIKDVLSFG